MDCLGGKYLLCESTRFIINGLVATAVHFLVLSANVIFFSFNSAALSGFFASLAGITASFLGNRYFVFLPVRRGELLMQLTKFLPLYLSISVLHTSILFLLTDLNGLDYRGSFVVSTIFQSLLSYFCNKHIIFRT